MRRRRERRASSDPAGVPAAPSAPEEPLGHENAASGQLPTSAGTPTAAYWTPGRPVAGHSTSMPSAGGGALGGQTTPGWQSSPADQPSSGSQSGSGSGYDVWTSAQSRDPGSQQTRPVSRDALAGQQPDSRQSETGQSETGQSEPAQGYFGTSSAPHEQSSSSPPYQPGRPSGSQLEYGGQSYPGRQTYGSQYTSGTQHTSGAEDTSGAQHAYGAQHGDGAASGGGGDQGTVSYQAYRGGQGEAGQNPTSYGQPSQGQPSQGQSSHGQGQTSQGQPSQGQSSYGQTGQTSQGQAPDAGWTGQQRDSGQRSYGSGSTYEAGVSLRAGALHRSDLRSAKLSRAAGLSGSGE